MKTSPRASISLWIQAVRAPFFTATLVPVLLAAAMAAYLVHGTNGNKVMWTYLPLVVAATLFLHAGTNLLNEYYDFIKGIDRPGAFSSSRVLPQGLLEPRQILSAGLSCLIAGFLIGMLLVWKRGLPLFCIGATGALVAYLYSGSPFGLKYAGMGDAAVFVCMGPLLCLGSFVSLTGVFSRAIVYASIPVGALVTAILHGNNLRDYRTDKQARIVTFAGMIGITAAKIWYVTLLGIAYASVALMSARGILPLLALTVGLSVPLALANIRAVMGVDADNLARIADIDVKTAKLHLIFGILLTGSIILSLFVSF
jgi:1,4-dihydroxy-2-naphthoate polyprenyltransferase